MQAFWQVSNSVVTPFSLGLLRILTQTFVLSGTVDDGAKDGGATATVHFPVHVLLFVISAMPKYTVHFYKGASQTSLTW